MGRGAGLEAKASGSRSLPVEPTTPPQIHLGGFLGFLSDFLEFLTKKTIFLRVELTTAPQVDLGGLVLLWSTLAVAKNT